MANIVFDFNKAPANALSIPSEKNNAQLNAVFTSNALQWEPGEFSNGVVSFGPNTNVFILHNAGTSQGANQRYVYMKLNNAPALYLGGIRFRSHTNTFGCSPANPVTIAIELSARDDFANPTLLGTVATFGGELAQKNLSLDVRVPAGSTNIRFRALSPIPDGSNYIAFIDVSLAASRIQTSQIVISAAISGQNYYPVVVPQESSSVQVSQNPQTWSAEAVEPRRHLSGITLSFGGQYLTATTVPLRYKNNCLVMSSNPALAVRLLPVPLDRSHWALRLVDNPDLVLTLDTRGFVTQFEPLQAADGFPYFQRLGIQGVLPGMAHQFFWIAQYSTGNVVVGAPPVVGTQLATAAMADSDDQLFWAQPSPDNATVQIISRLGAYALDLGTVDGTGTGPVKLNKSATAGQASQNWTLDQNLYLLNKQTGTCLTAPSSPGPGVTVSPKVSPPNAVQRFVMQPYANAPNPGQNQFVNLQPGASFALRTAEDNRVLTVTGAAGAERVIASAALTPLPAAQLWTYKNQELINLATSHVLSVSANGAVGLIPEPAQPGPSQSWVYDSNGFLFTLQLPTQVLVTQLPTGDSPVSLAAFDPTGKTREFWILQLAARPSSGHFTTMAAFDGPAIGTPIATLKVKMTLSNSYFAGTADDIYVSFSDTQENWTQIMHWPSRGDSNEVSIDLASMFPGRTVRFQDLTQLYLGFDAGSPVFADQGKIDSIIITATDASGATFTNRSFEDLNMWVEPKYRSIFHWSRPVSWSGYISWAAWTNQAERAIDLITKTYPVGLIPYILDIVNWRTYDPSSIDGVGLLIGRLNGQIVGEQLKSKTCEILRPGPYTWVYAPDGNSVIYKFWEKDAPDRNSYTRHSQLGSGNSVICAGEMEIAAQGSFNGLTNVIVMVNDASGHYKPDGGASLKYFAQKLQLLGIATDQVGWYWRDP